MALQVLGLQASRSAGTEATFDGQPMTAGTHLRRSLTPQLGFPPGAFWLLHRTAKHDERHTPPPGAVTIDQAERGGSNFRGGPVNGHRRALGRDITGRPCLRCGSTCGTEADHRHDTCRNDGTHHPGNHHPAGHHPAVPEKQDSTAIGTQAGGSTVPITAIKLAGTTGVGFGTATGVGFGKVAGPGKQSALAWSRCPRKQRKEGLLQCLR